MVSEAAIRETLEKIPGQYAEEVKEDTFADLQQQYQSWKNKGNSSARGSSFLSNINRSIRNSYGKEFCINNTLSQELKEIEGQKGSFGIINNTKFRHSDEAGRPNNMSQSNFIGSLDSLVLPQLPKA